MGIEVNDTAIFPTAKSRLTPPITSADCPVFPAFEQLVTAEHVAGRGSTIRHGRGWAKRTKAELEASCTPATPSPTSTVPTALIRTWPFVLYGTGFYDVVGQVHIGNASTWAACTIKTLQPISAWAPTRIDVSAATWYTAPATVWLYVLNKFGLRNPNGLGRVLNPPP